MNTLSYLSLMSQSLVRYDMGNNMLEWAQGMSKTSLGKRNFRQLKKFLQNKGYEYTRPYPYKGKERCTVSLLDIVRQIESDKFLKPHWGIMDTDVQHLYLTPTQPLDDQKVGRIGREVPEIDACIAQFAYTHQTLPLPTESERFQEANQMVIDIIEGKIPGNPLDLYGIVTKSHRAQLVPDIRRQTSIENPIIDKILMGHTDFEFDQETSELIARNGGIEGVAAIMAKMLLSDYEPKTEGELSDIDIIMNTPTYRELRKGVLDNINRERGIDNKEDE